MPLSFDNTQIAFSSQSNAALQRSYWMFRMISSPAMVKLGSWLTNFAVATHLPVKWLIKPTIFRHFCGGETVEESRAKMNELAKQNIKSILDYSAEGKESEADFDNCMQEIISIIREAKQNQNIGFSVFKPTGIARFKFMEGVSQKMEEGKTLIPAEQEEYDKVKSRFDFICKAAYDAGVPVFVDAEETWIQPMVDQLVNEMMSMYNKQKPIVYNTFQLYRKDRLDFLKMCYTEAQSKNYFMGAKLVRGAYMEKERERAYRMNYPSPINDTKEITDAHYDSALRFCMDHLDRISFCCASHNEKSSMLVVEVMKERGFPPNHPHIYFSQLLGMSDHISYNLASAGYNVSKYVPYGPLRDVLPYLIRRAQENTSVKGQTGRELNLITKEIKRRKGLQS